MEGRKSSENGLQYAQVTVVMVPFLAQGHLNQLLNLSNLVSSYGITVHYVGSTTHNRKAKLRLHGWDPEDSLSKIHFHDLELPRFSSPIPDPNVAYFPAHLHPVLHASTHLRQPVCQLLQELATKFKRVVVIHDNLMASVVQDVKSIPNAKAYLFVSVSAFTMFTLLWEQIPEKPFQIDSDVVPICLPSAEDCWTQEVAEFLDYQRQFWDFQSGILYNTCRVIEGKYVDLLERITNNAKVMEGKNIDQFEKLSDSAGADVKYFAIGPFNPVVKSKREKERHGCLQWLEKQELDSVIYVSFGTTTSMTDDQIKELALGLEKSRQKFIWVLRTADKADISEDDQVRRPQLPEGYEKRVKDRGLVVREWAPQLEILAHPSTGGFMSHCGWNSCLESFSVGVPVAAWPMHSDQPRNAALITEVLRTGLLVRDWAKRAELISSTTIEDVVRRLIATKEGARMRKRAAEIGQKVQGAVAKGGATHLEMEAFISHMTK